MKKESAKTYHLNVAITPQEYTRLRLEFGQSTCRFFSEYIRTLVQRKPVKLRFRNASLDDFLPVALQIKNELEEIRKAYAQILKTLQTFSSGNGADEAIQFLLSEAVMLNHNIERIRTTLINMSEKCTG